MAAVSHRRIAVSANPTPLNQPRRQRTRLDITNVTEHPCYLGDADVTTRSGYPLAANASITIDLSAGAQIFAVRDPEFDVAVALLQT